MNTNLGLIGKKLGNTQLFEEDGTVVRVTAIEAGPCVVIGKRSVEKDGYVALQIGFGVRSAKHVDKPSAGRYKKAGVEAVKTAKEFRVAEEVAARYDVGQKISPADLFKEGQVIDVCGQTKGRGFTGVMKRWNFSGAGTDTHGTHEVRRHGGSIGCNLTPGRTLPGQKMPGQYGSERVTILNLKITKVLEDKNILLVKGAVPGARGGILTVRPAVKKPAPVLEAASA